MTERCMMNLATSKRNFVLKHNKLKMHQLFLGLDVLDGRSSNVAPLEEKARKGAEIRAETMTTMNGIAGTEIEAVMEGSGAEVETVRRKGGGTRAEITAMRGAGSEEPSVTVIAIGEYFMPESSHAACRFLVFRYFCFVAG